MSQAIPDVARPFEGLQGFSEFWTTACAVTWQGTPQEWVDNSLAFRVGEDAKLQLEAEIDLRQNQESVELWLAEAGIKPSALKLELRLRRPLLKINRPVFGVALDQILGKLINVPLLPASDAEGLDQAACVFEFILALGSEIPSFPGKVSQKGTWISRAHVHLEPAKIGDSGFRYERLDAEVRKTLNLHERSLYFVEHVDALHECENLAAAAKVYVDDKYFRYLHAAPNAKVRKWEQTRFVVLVTTELILHSLGVMRKSGIVGLDAVSAQSPMRKVIRDLAALPLADGSKQSEDQLLENWASNPGRVAEAVAHWAGEQSSMPPLGNDETEDFQ